LKKQAEARFLEWGMTVDDAIALFYERVAGQCSAPFSPHIPNAETTAAIEEASRGEGLTEYASFSESLEKLD
jgi:addiction module RelB/DinJ family antitoxin